MSWTDHLPGEHIRDSLSNYKFGREQEGARSPWRFTTVRYPCFPHFLKGERGGNRESVRAEIWSSPCEADQSAVAAPQLGGTSAQGKPQSSCHSLVTQQLVTPTSSTSDSPQVLPAAVVETVVVVALVVAAGQLPAWGEEDR